MHRLNLFTILFTLATAWILTFGALATAQNRYPGENQLPHYDLMPIKPSVANPNQFGRPYQPQSQPPNSAVGRWQSAKLAQSSRPNLANRSNFANKSNFANDSKLANKSNFMIRSNRSDNRFAENTGYAPVPTFSTGEKLPDRRRTNRVANRIPTLEEEFSPEELVNINVYERSNRSVVNITTRISRGGGSTMQRLRESTRGSGSGFVIDREGHVLTNHHVIKGANSAMVTLFDGESYSAKLVGSDPPNDIALLKIDAPGDALFPIEIGESSRLRVGQKVFAIGNPFGLERTFTIGILSSKNRTLPTESGHTMKSILQIDAALNSGNSGGPLLNSRGQLIGMNTAIASPSGRGENTGVGFSIPVSTLRRVVPELLENGRVVRPDAGIAHVYETDRGLMVAELIPDGPAEEAGLRSFRIVRERSQQGAVVIERYHVDRENADTIVAVNGKSTRKADKFLEQIESYRPGDRVNITVLRDDRPVDVAVTLSEDR